MYKTLQIAAINCYYSYYNSRQLGYLQNAQRIIIICDSFAFSVQNATKFLSRKEKNQFVKMGIVSLNA